MGATRPRPAKGGTMATRNSVAAVVAAACLGCGRAPKVEEKVPPAPVKWEAARQLVLEEWTELVGTTQPLPDRAARVTAPVEGRVIFVLGTAEGQTVKAGDMLVRLDPAALVANRDKAEASKRVTQA